MSVALAFHQQTEVTEFAKTILGEDLIEKINLHAYFWQCHLQYPPRIADFLRIPPFKVFLTCSVLSWQNRVVPEKTGDKNRKSLSTASWSPGSEKNSARSFFSPDCQGLGNERSPSRLCRYQDDHTVFFPDYQEAFYKKPQDQQQHQFFSTA